MLLRFARVSSYLDDFNNRNKNFDCQTSPAGALVSWISKCFLSKFYRRHYELVSKHDTELKILLLHGLSEPKFRGDFA